MKEKTFKTKEDLAIEKVGELLNREKTLSNYILDTKDGWEMKGVPVEHLKQSIKRLKEKIIQKGKETLDISMKRGFARACVEIDKEFGEKLVSIIESKKEVK